ncbi:MAG: iron ABC transporter permease [Elusimicrobiota bacterium]
MDRKSRTIRILLYLLFSFVLLVPMLFFYAGSFWKNGNITLQDYVESWPSAAQWRALGNSLRLGIAATLLSFVFGLPVAVALSRLERRWRHFLTTLCLIPLMIPPYLTASAWVVAAGKRTFLNLLLMRVFSTAESPLSLFNFGGCVWVFSLSYWPIIALLGCASLRLIDRRQEDAGRLFAAGPPVFRKITLPLIWPSLAAAGGIVFLLVIADFGVPDLLLFRAYTNEALQSFRWGPDMPAAAAVSLPLVLCVALVVALIGLCPAKRSPLLVGGSAEISQRPSSRKGAAGFLSWTILVLSLSVAFPVATFVSASASWDAYREAFRMGGGLIANSFWVAALGAASTLLFCLPLAHMTNTGTRGERMYVQFVSLLTFALPATVVGVGLISLYNRPGLPEWIYRSLGIMVLAYVARFFFIAWTGVSAVLAGVDPSLFEAARISGASPWRAYRVVFLPLAKGSLWALFLVLFILCFGELGIGVLLTPAGYRTLPVTLFGLLHFGYERLVMALCLIFFMSIVIPTAAAMYIWRRYGDSRFI